MVKEMYTIAEVARLLRFSEITIRLWVREGRIRAVRPGMRAYRIPRAEVERLLGQHGIDPSVLGGVADGGTIEEDALSPGHVARLHADMAGA